MGGPRDPERGWQRLVGLTGSAGDTVDLSKIPPETHAMLRGFTERSGGIPYPETGIWTKEMYLDHFAKNEAARAAFAANNGNNPSPTSAMNTTDPNGMGFGRGRGMGMGDPNGWGPGGWNPGGWNPGGWDPNAGGQRPGFEKKETEEERPVAMRYGKLPKGLPSWFDELDTDKDGQVSLFEWRKSGKDTKEFIEMDLNGDGLVTADEYLRFARQKNIDTKVAAYEDGLREPGNWNLGEKLNSGERPKGPGGYPGFSPGGNRGGDGTTDKGPTDGKTNDGRNPDKSERKKGDNPFRKGNN
jgi:hypothetical protein